MQFSKKSSNHRLRNSHSAALNNTRKLEQNMNHAKVEKYQIGYKCLVEFFQRLISLMWLFFLQKMPMLKAQKNSAMQSRRKPLNEILIEKLEYTLFEEVLHHRNSIDWNIICIEALIELILWMMEMKSAFLFAKFSLPMPRNLIL